MKKNGFTLIELLAVIVILALIALITTPIITGIIEDARKGSTERSVEGYIKTAQDNIMRKMARGEDVADGSYTIQEGGDLCPSTGCTDETRVTVQLSGNKPTGGSVRVEDGTIVLNQVTVEIDGYTVTVDETGEAHISE